VDRLLGHLYYPVAITAIGVLVLTLGWLVGIGG
jgi:hypothetical protein